MDYVSNYLNNLIKDGDIVVAAVSGGPDSMCMLHLLCELRKDIKIVVAHVNHKVRVASEAEAVFVEGYCKKRNVTYEYMEITEYSCDNFHNEAREKRYEFFTSLVKKYHAKYLMTAHHGDDLMETILMRLVRGSNIKGYAGFKGELDMKDFTIVRPLITVSKDEILKFMQDNFLEYVTDESNFKETYTRNRYRIHVLPFLKKEQRDVHKKFLKFSKELEETNDFIDKCVLDILPRVMDENVLLIDKLLEYDKFLVKKLLEYILSKIYIDDLFLISDKHTNLILKMIYEQKSTDTLELPGGYVVYKNYNSLEIKKRVVNERFKFLLEQSVTIPGRGTIKKVDTVDNNSNYVIRLNSSDIKLPLYVRSRASSDYIEVKNLNGKKKIKDIFIDCKVNRDIRDTYPLVVDSNDTILWVPGLKKSKFDVDKTQKCDIILIYEEEK